MKHAYDKTANCQCERCTKERSRRSLQAADSQTGKIILPARKRLARTRVASRAEQHARYIDSGPQNWDDTGSNF
jgi:hypothetical protein